MPEITPGEIKAPLLALVKEVLSPTSATVTLRGKVVLATIIGPVTLEPQDVVYMAYMPSTTEFVILGPVDLPLDPGVDVQTGPFAAGVTIVPDATRINFDPKYFEVLDEGTSGAFISLLGGEILAVSHGATPFVSFYRRTGTEFNKLIGEPDTLPPQAGDGIAWSDDGEFIAVANVVSSPYLTVYRRFEYDFNKIPDTSFDVAVTGDAYDVSWSPNGGEFLAVAHNVSPRITVYWRSFSTFTKLANPATLPGDRGISCAWSPSGEFLAVGIEDSPYVIIYQRSGTGASTILTKLANPATLPSSFGHAVAWSPDERFLAVGTGATPFIHVYERSGTTFTKLSDSVFSALPPDLVDGLDWSHNGVYLACAHDTFPHILVYKRSGTTFTKLNDVPSIPDLPTERGVSVAWSPNDRFLAVGHQEDPNITIYLRSGDVFTKLDGPADTPEERVPSNAYGVAWSPTVCCG